MLSKNQTESYPISLSDSKSLSKQESINPTSVDLWYN